MSTSEYVLHVSHFTSDSLCAQSRAFPLLEMFWSATKTNNYPITNLVSCDARLVFMTFMYDSSLQTADVFPFVVSLPPKNNEWNKSRKKRLLPAGYVASAFVLFCLQKAVILLQTIASQKEKLGGPSIRSAAHVHISHEKAKTIFSRPKKNFHKRYFKVKMKITPKTARKLTRTSREKSRFL